jgi:phosphate transport system substrate-binding protein
MRNILCVPAILACFAFQAPAADVAVIANKAGKTESLTKAQLRRMLLGELTTLPGGVKITVLLGPVGTPERIAALKAICGMSESDFNKYFMHASFVGSEVTPPRTLPSPVAVGFVVQTTQNAIGVVAAEPPVPNVKVVKIDGMLPGTDGYPLSVP